MSISKERLEEIKRFPEDFTDSDCPILTAEQLAQMKPCHLVDQKKEMKSMKDLEKLIAECEKNALLDNQIDLSDCPELTDEELKQLRPCHL